MSPSPQFCEPCAQGGVTNIADYLYQPEETSLIGPTMGDPDYWPPHIAGRRFLCQEHYARLPVDSQIDYVSARDRFGPSGEAAANSSI